jgi:hypothetical protein
MQWFKSAPGRWVSDVRADRPPAKKKKKKKKGKKEKGKRKKEKRKKSKFPRTSSLAREGLNPALVEVMMF